MLNTESQFLAWGGESEHEYDVISFDQIKNDLVGYFYHGWRNWDRLALIVPEEPDGWPELHPVDLSYPRKRTMNGADMITEYYSLRDGITGESIDFTITVDGRA